MKNYFNMKMLIKQLLITISTIAVIGCANSTDTKYKQTGGLTTIPLPPQKLNESTVPKAVLDTPNNKQNASATQPNRKGSNQFNSQKTNQRGPRIEETRINGEVVQIKVDNNGKVPSYYIYPSQQIDSNGRNTTDTSISTPTWQIKW